MIGPKEYAEMLQNVNVDEYIPKIDTLMVKESRRPSHPWVDIIIDEEIPLAARNVLAKKYKDAGWYYVYHRTSSENGERPGLTRMIFTTESTDPKFRGVNDVYLWRH